LSSATTRLNVVANVSAPVAVKTAQITAGVK